MGVRSAVIAKILTETNIMISGRIYLLEISRIRVVFLVVLRCNFPIVQYNEDDGVVTCNAST